MVISCAALLFDMDGVLVDSTPAVARVWAQWALRHGLDPELSIRKAHGRPSLATVQELLPHASPETHLSENAWMEQAEIADIADVIALPGTTQLLSQLPAERFCVVTSATRALANVRLEAAGLLKYVRHMVAATDIVNGKPDPEPYLKGAARLNFSPKDCAVVEDAASGVRSGKAAGCSVIGVRTTMNDRGIGESRSGLDCGRLRRDSAVGSARRRIAS